MTEEEKDDWPEGMLRRAQEALEKSAPVKPNGPLVLPPPSKRT